MGEPKRHRLAPGRTARRGFTLVELMIVVAIIGVLAALAIYGVRRYLSHAKTSEARDLLGAIRRGATAAYERGRAPSQKLQEGTESNVAEHSLCDSALMVPATVPVGTKYQPKTGNGEDFETGGPMTGWKCLRVRMNAPIYYQYTYAKDGSVKAPANPAVCNGDCYEAAAEGDLDADGSHAIFAITGHINTQTGRLKSATNIYVLNESE